MVNYFTQESMKRELESITEREEAAKKLYKQIDEVCDGDWHDNAGYDYLQEQVRIADNIIQGKKNMVRDSRVIEYPSSVDSVVVGSAVRLMKDNDELTYKIVALGDDNSEDYRISYKTPIASILIGHKVGDEYKSKFRNTEVFIKILDLKPLPEQFRKGYKD